MILLDTDVLIEFARGREETVGFISSLESIPTPGVVAMELLSGSRNQNEHLNSQRLLDALEIVWHTENDNKIALQLLTRHRLSSGLSVPDYWIAAQAINLNAILYTFNLKHFSSIPGLTARAPHFRN